MVSLHTRAGQYSFKNISRSPSHFHVQGHSSKVTCQNRHCNINTYPQQTLNNSNHSCQSRSSVAHFSGIRFVQTLGFTTLKVLQILKLGQIAELTESPVGSWIYLPEQHFKLASLSITCSPDLLLKLGGISWWAGVSKPRWDAVPLSAVIQFRVSCP